jgi:hypothetical protein
MAVTASSAGSASTQISSPVGASNWPTVARSALSTPGRAIQARHALAHQRRRVGHGAHHALGAQPAGDAVRRNARGHAQVQGVLGERAHRAGGVREGLGLDRPDHHAAARQGRAGLGTGRDAERMRQLGAGFLEGLDDLELVGRRSLLDQAADDGAGHVAAADEGDGRQRGKGRGAGAGEEGDGDGHGRSAVGRYGLCIRKRRTGSLEAG